MGNSIGREDPVDYDAEVELRHFTLLRCIGKGAFGKVRIVERKSNKKLYALKYINKMQCIKMRAIQNIFRERAILEEIHHPLIVNLRYAFQDDENMFMVIDLMMGGDLRFHLDRNGGFQEMQMRNITAEIVSAVEYLHANKVVHRDLKPDNVLLDAEGHAHLTDFNIAVKFDNRKYLKSHSGTMAYMAPEIFGDKGYLWQVDWWSLGIIVYECIYGKRPFRSPTNEGLQQAIKTAPLTFHSSNQLTKQPLQVTNECVAFISGLLERDISNRLGCRTNGGRDIFDHLWFRGLDWNSVERKKTRPLFVPDADRPNFDATFDLEELLLDEPQLTHKPRKKKTIAKQSQRSKSGERDQPCKVCRSPGHPHASWRTRQESERSGFHGPRRWHQQRCRTRRWCSRRRWSWHSHAASRSRQPRRRQPKRCGHGGDDSHPLRECGRDKHGVLERSNGRGAAVYRGQFQKLRLRNRAASGAAAQAGRAGKANAFAAAAATAAATAALCRPGRQRRRHETNGPDPGTVQRPFFVRFTRLEHGPQHKAGGHSFSPTDAGGSCSHSGAGGSRNGAGTQRERLVCCKRATAAGAIAAATAAAAAGATAAFTDAAATSAAATATATAYTHPPAANSSHRTRPAS
ncbi:kinase-like domain-containing protein [Zopfochytrium polystomum]|nr:kinase-like domain-containing protein [Zopfochytrium polystomum]